MFNGRSVIEIMVIVFTFIVAFMIVGLGVMIMVVEFVHPESDTGLIANTLMSLVSGILGALLGIIAGKSAANGLSGGDGGIGSDLGRRPDGSEGDLDEPP